MSGYLGQRFLLKAQTSVGVALARPTTKNRELRGNNNPYSNGIEHYGLNFGYGLDASWAIGRHHQVALGGALQRAGMEMRAFRSNGNEFELYYHLTGWQSYVAYRWFKQKHLSLAPIGVYRGLRLAMTNISGTLIDQDPSPTPTFSIDPNTRLFAISYEFGRHFPIGDHLVIGYGGQLSFPLFLEEAFQVTYTGEVFQSAPSNSEDLFAYHQEQFERYAKNRFAGFNALTFHFQIGYLIF